MHFQVHAWIFAQLNFSQAPSSIFVSVAFTKVLIKDLVRILIHVCVKYRTVRYLLSMCLVIGERGL